MKRLLAFLFSICLLMCLCACEKDNVAPTDVSTTGSGEPNQTPADPQPNDPKDDPQPNDPDDTPQPNDPDDGPAPTTVSVPRILNLTTTRYAAGAFFSENVSTFTYEGDIATLCTHNGDFLNTRNTYNHKTNTLITAASFFTDGKANYYEYDSYGTQISSKRYTNDVLNQALTTQATYVDGKLMERKTFYDNGRLMSHFKYEYNSDGKPTAYIEYSVYEEGVESGRDTFIYDDQGRKIEQISVTYSINSTLHYYFKYDANGNEIEKVCCDDDGAETSRTVTSYDDQGRIHEVIYSYEGALRTRGVHLYDDQGYRIGFESYNANGDLVYKTAISYEMIDVAAEDAQDAISFYESMSKRT